MSNYLSTVSSVLTRNRKEKYDIVSEALYRDSRETQVSIFINLKLFYTGRSKQGEWSEFTFQRFYNVDPLIACFVKQKLRTHRELAD